MTKTLFVGLGGMGGHVLSALRKLIAREWPEGRDHLFLVMDSDRRELDRLEKGADLVAMPMNLPRPAGDCIKQRQSPGQIMQWFPKDPGMLNAMTDSGIGRVGGRLTFLVAKNRWNAATVEYSLYNWLCREQEIGKLRIVIVTSLSGNFGSGTFMQVALWLKQIVRKAFGFEPEVCGFFAGPEVHVQGFQMPVNRNDTACYLRANACAALQELSWLTQIMLGQLEPPEPFDLDGLYKSTDKTVHKPIFHHAYIYDAIRGEKEKCPSYAEHIDCMAKSLLLRYASNMTAVIDTQFYLNHNWESGRDIYIPLDEDLSKTWDLLDRSQNIIPVEKLPFVESEACVAAYLQICNRARQMLEYDAGPHIDKRFLKWFYE